MTTYSDEELYTILSMYESATQLVDDAAEFAHRLCDGHRMIAHLFSDDDLIAAAELLLQAMCVTAFAPRDHPNIASTSAGSVVSLSDARRKALLHTLEDARLVLASASRDLRAAKSGLRRDAERAEAGRRSRPGAKASER